MEILLNDLNSSAVRKAYKSKNIALHWVDTCCGRQAESRECDAICSFLRYTGGATCHIGHLLQCSRDLPFDLVFESLCDGKIQQDCAQSSTTLVYNGRADDVRRIVDGGIKVDIKEGFGTATSDGSAASSHDESSSPAQTLNHFFGRSVQCRLVVEKAIDRLKFPYELLETEMYIVRECNSTLDPTSSDSKPSHIDSKFLQVCRQVLSLAG